MTVESKKLKVYSRNSMQIVALYTVEAFESFNLYDTEGNRTHAGLNGIELYAALEEIAPDWCLEI